jgi:hypothetical protein
MQSLKTQFSQKTDQELISILQDGADLSPEQAEALAEVLNERNIDPVTGLSKADIPATEESDARPVDLEYRKVDGWLLFLCISLTILTPLFGGYNLVTGFLGTYQYFDYMPVLKVVVYFDSFAGILITLLSIWTGLGLWSKRENCVPAAKKFMFILLGYSLISASLPYIVGFAEEAVKAMIPATIKSVVQSLVYFGIWFTYLSLSERVKQTYAYNKVG